MLNPMAMIDSHCHLTSEALYARLDEVLQRAHAAGVSGLVTIATDAADSRRAVAVADHYDGVHATIGIHPHQAGNISEADWNCLRELRHNPNVVGWGEIGLDYHYDFAERTVQQEVFARQLEMARRARLPLVIHCREAVADVLGHMDRHAGALPRVVFHCFTGTAAEADAIIERGWWLSFTGVVTFKNSSELQAIARRYPVEQLMLETDAPYLSPEPMRRARPNEPALMVHTARFIAALKGIALDDLIARTTANARAFFGLE